MFVVDSKVVIRIKTFFAINNVKMVQKCVVLGCKSKWNPGCSLIFHSFPTDPIRKDLWLPKVKLTNKFYETAKICSNNFVYSDYIMGNRLKSTAIPFYSDELTRFVTMEVGFGNGNITLDHDNDVYYSGQVINGNIYFRLAQQVNITAINIQFLGEARVLWWEEEKEVRSGQTFKTRVDYRGHEQYFNNVQCLTGGQGVQQLKAGPHTIPFQFQIPYLVPSSFKGEKGEVVYEIHAFMEFPEQTKNREELGKIFEVVAPLDLNKLDPEIAQPLQLDFEEVFGGCCCGGGALSAALALPATGFCPRQPVPLTIDVRNEASIEVKAIVLEIVSKTRYHSQQPIAEYSTPEQTLVRSKTSAVLSRSERHCTCDLMLPDMVAPNLNNCSIIDVEYFLKVKIKLSGCNEDLEDMTQLFIGLKPLDNIAKGEYVHPLPDRLPAGPIPDILETMPPQVSQESNPLSNAYPGYPSAPGYPNQPQISPYPNQYPAAPYPNANPGYPSPNFDIGFRNPAPTNVPFNPPYPNQNLNPNVGHPGWVPNQNSYNNAPSAPNF